MTRPLSALWNRVSSAVSSTTRRARSGARRTAAPRSRRAFLESLEERSLLANSIFTYVGAAQSFTVPSGITSIKMLAVGGGGGGANGHQGGGASGIVSVGTFSVTPGEVLSINVGDGGDGAVAQNDNSIVGITPGSTSSILRGVTGILVSPGGQVVTSTNGVGNNGGSGGGGSGNSGLGGAGGTGGGNGVSSTYAGGLGQGSFLASLALFTERAVTAGSGGAGGTMSHGGGGGGGGVLIDGLGGGGASGTQPASGKGGAGFGGGGGAGGYNSDASTRFAGGSGASGVVYLEYGLSSLSLSQATIAEGESTTLSGSFTDQNVGGTYTLNLNWDDPNSPNNLQTFILGPTPLTVAANGINWNPTTHSFSLPHQYLDDTGGPFDISATVTNEPDTLFAITQDGIVAETLPYGPTVITTASNAFLSTSYANSLHDHWTQVATSDGSTELFKIEWQFASSKTLKQRFIDSVAVGEPVTWTVTSAAFGTQTYTGTWQFSNNAGDMAAKFAGSGSNFSDDDGVWGAGSGLLNANGNGLTTWQWGHANNNSSDSSDTLARNGVRTQSVAPVFPNFKNFMYLGVESSISAQTSVTVQNVAPSLALELPSSTIQENGSTTLTGTITDVGTLDTFTLNLNWGDPLSPNPTQSFTFGTSPLTVAADGINWNPTTREFSLPHQYLDDNPSVSSSDQYTISVSVIDDDGGISNGELLEGMRLENQWTDYENQTGELPVHVWGTGDTQNANRIGMKVTFANGLEGTVTYSGIAGHWNNGLGAINYATATGFFTSALGLQVVSNTSTFLPMAWQSFVMPFSNNFDLDYFSQLGSHFRASVAGWGSAEFKTYSSSSTTAAPTTIKVTVNNVAPTIGLSLSSDTIYENDGTTLTGTITDPGTNDTFTLDLNWGDPLSLDDGQTFALGTTTLTIADDGIDWNPATRVFSLPHQYLDDNPSDSDSDPYTITVNVTDDDGSSLAEEATIGLTVENLNPVAAAQTVSTTEDAASTPINVLVGLTDIGTLDTHTAVAASGAVVGGGLYTLTEDGSLTFDPNGEYEYLSVGQSVTRTISFTIVDDDGGSSTETVTITVNGVNDAPLANPDTNSTTEHAPVTTPVLGNDTDVDQADVKVLSTFSIASMTFEVNGAAIPVVTATVTDNDGSIVFNPGNDFDFLPAGATATVVINYTMRDGRFEPLPTEIAANSSSTLTITVNGENDAPVGNGDSYTTAEDTPLIIAAPGVLGNDTDVDFGTNLTVYSFMQPAHGTVAVTASGSFTYTPNADYNGPDSFRYRTSDGTAQTSFTTVTLTVTATDDFDFGDAPASYGVASHFEGAGFIGDTLNSGPLLSTRDFETAIQPSVNADGDDLNSTDDEDGVSFSSTTLVPRFNTTITVNASAAGQLDAWIDFNRNNVFDVGEKIANGLSVVAGSNTLVVPVPDNLTSGVTYARFRISSSGISLPTGLAADGEVEDYKLSIQAQALNSAVVIDDPENPGSESPDVLVIKGTDGFYEAIAVRITKAATLTAPAIVTVYIAPNVSIGSFPLNSFGRIVVFGRGGMDAISIESPIDKPTTLYGDAGNDSISGGLGPDIIIGGEGNDTMAGNAGDDVFLGGLGNDNIAGGAGFDRFVEMVGAATVTNNSSKVGTSSDTFSQIEQIELTGTAASEAFTLTGVNLIVLLNAGDGTDTLAYTGDGNVVLTNSLLTRTQGTVTYNLSLTTIESLRLNGGQSNDSFDLTAWTKSLILSGGAGTDTIAAANDVNYSLSDTFLMRTGLPPIAQSTMENALLTGGASSNTFDISGWTKTATLNGNGGTDKLVVADNVTTSTLSNTTLTRTSRGNITLASIEAAEITDGAGNNTINASTFSGQLKVDGAAGNDTITGGTGPSLLLGGLGNDVLKSGTGRTVLIGGQGLDKLTGNTNDDLLIAGQTFHDNNTAALAAILAEWAAVTNSYATRVVNLTSPGALLESNKVTHDNAIDVLLGGLGDDLFFAKQVTAVNSPKDTYTDKTPGESIF